ncbi:MAG: putative RNA uridine N3 methyltransferase [Candidatus Bathyarchaeia archaeon]
MFLFYREERMKKLSFKRKLSIAIPASLVSDIPHLREKTLKIGMVGRAAAIFGVDEIVVFPDSLKLKQFQEINLIVTVLSYMETPQYLRKRLFKIKPELRYVGVLPPLRTPHHPLANHVKDLVDGEYREGIAVSHTREGTLVDIGLEQQALLKHKKIPINMRITTRIKKTKKTLKVEIANRNEIKEYWGYRVTSPDLMLTRFLRKEAFDLFIATSKYGVPFFEASEELTCRWNKSPKILVVFGAPQQGLYEIVEQENMDLNNLADFVINTIPDQKVETIRTEEAILVTLGILNLMVAKG